MKKHTLYILVAVIFCIQTVSLFRQPQRVDKTHSAVAPIRPASPVHTAPPLSMPSLPSSSHGVQLKLGDYAQLPSWGQVSLKKSFSAFQVSCHAFLKQDPNDLVGSHYISLKAKDWYPACQAAAKVDIEDQVAIQSFFQTWFVPVEFQQGKPVNGLFTGYYMPLIKGSLHKSSHYSVPIYAVPPNLLTAHLPSFSQDLPHKKIIGHVVSKKMVPFYTRAEINEGAIAKSTKVLAWVNNEVDRLILETEGSGVIQLEKGDRLVVGYDATNGAAYRSLATILINKGYMSADEASVSHIQSFFKKHPEKLRPLINQNKSFVFFRQIPENLVMGGQGVKLSAGYSLAIDRKWIPMGVPLWLTTTIYDEESHATKPFNRLMIAQDTGGSIRGMVRGDIYMGEGEQATAIATKIRNPGHYWLLLPRKLNTA